MDVSFFNIEFNKPQTRYREGQEDQLGALELVLNIIVLWNTLYKDAALEELRKEDYPMGKATPIL